MNFLTAIVLFSRAVTPMYELTKFCFIVIEKVINAVYFFLLDGLSIIGHFQLDLNSALRQQPIKLKALGMPMV